MESFVIGINFMFVIFLKQTYLEAAWTHRLQDYFNSHITYILHCQTVGCSWLWLISHVI